MIKSLSRNGVLRRTGIGVVQSSVVVIMILFCGNRRSPLSGTSVIWNHWYSIELHCVWTLDQPYEESYEWYVGSMTCGDRINHIIAGPQHSFTNFQY